MESLKICHFCEFPIFSEYQWLCANVHCPMDRYACPLCYELNRGVYSCTSGECIQCDDDENQDQLQMLVPSSNVDECCVCLEGETCFTRTKCNHPLCEICLLQLVQLTCPMCRTQLD